MVGMIARVATRVEGMVGRVGMVAMVGMIARVTTRMEGMVGMVARPSHEFGRCGRYSRYGGYGSYGRYDCPFGHSDRRQANISCKLASTFYSSTNHECFVY